MKSVFLACALSVPPAFVAGPAHKNVCVEVFKMLLRSQWSYPDMEEPGENPSIIVIGRDGGVLRSLRAMGWDAFGISPLAEVDVQGSTLSRLFPFRKHAFRIAFYAFPLPIDPFEMKTVVVDVGRTIRMGGFFLIPDDEDWKSVYVMKTLNYDRLPIRFDYEGRIYGIYQKHLSRSRLGFVATRRIKESA